MAIRSRIPGGLLRDLARAMRRKPTSSERTAGKLLRNRRCLGLKFRRQHIVAGYIIDFYCPELHLALEVDGVVHEDAAQRWKDEERTAALERAGIRVVRIWNDELSMQRLGDLLHPYCREPERRSTSPYHGKGDRG